jgi:hypothetical protein
MKTFSMNTLCLLTAMFTYSVSAGASSSCIDLSGTYTFEEGCSSSNYSGGPETLILPVSGTVIGLQLGTVLKITQTNCKEFSLSYMQGTNRTTTYRSDNLTRVSINEDQARAIHRDVSIRRVRHYEYSLEIEPTVDGVSMAISVLNRGVFDMFAKPIENTCELVKQ